MMQLLLGMPGKVRSHNQSLKQTISPGGRMAAEVTLSGKDVNRISMSGLPPPAMPPPSSVLAEIIGRKLAKEKCGF